MKLADITHKVIPLLKDKFRAIIILVWTIFSKVQISQDFKKYQDSDEWLQIGL